LVRKIKKTRPLCVTTNFLDFAAQCGWNQKTTDAAALVMHKYFLETRKKKKKGHYYLTDWVRIHSNYFIDILGSDYRQILAKLEESGFLERKRILKYIPGKQSSRFRLGSELLWEDYTASYRLQTERLQQRFLSTRARLYKITSEKRKALVAKLLEENFPAKEYPIDDTIQIRKSGKKITYHIPRFFKYIEGGTFTIEQLEVYKKIVTNVYKLKLDISEQELSVIAHKRHREQNRRCDVSALQDVYRSYLEGVLIPRMSIDPRGRMYTPFTSLPREFWDYVTYRGKALAAIDVKTSQVYCLLGFIKDIYYNYFSGSLFQTHAERLAQCCFGRQIASVPGLDDHLRRCSALYQVTDLFKFMGQQSKDNESYRKRCNKLFSAFTRICIRILCSQGNQVIEKEIYTGRSNLLQSNVPNFFNLDVPTFFRVPTSTHSVSTPTRPVSVHDIEQEYITYYHINHELTSKLRALNFFPNPTKSSQNPIDVRHENSKENDVGHEDVGQNIPRFRDLFFPCKAEIDEFEKILSGDLYDDLMIAVNVKGKQSRDDFKGDFFHFLYRQACVKEETIIHGKHLDLDYIEKVDEPIRKAFETLLPAIMLFIDICKSAPGTLSKKGTSYKLLPTAMQSVESQIIMECCTNLLCKYPKMFLVTLHDCIRCLPKDVAIVKAEMERVFKKYMIEPELKVKYHGKSFALPNTQALEKQTVEK